MQSQRTAKASMVAWSLAEVPPSYWQAPMAGVDEAGRGPLAGPVVAAAVILSDELSASLALAGLKDSKKCTYRIRCLLEEEILAGSVSYYVGSATVAEIDELNILQASLLAMQRAVEGLTVMPTSALVDGNQLPRLSCPAMAIVKGDGLVPEISAASILAKQARDREMERLAEIYPQYGFAQHKGYPTKAHLEALSREGICDVHRRSFAPVRRLLATAIKPSAAKQPAAKQPTVSKRGMM